jgi:hypothetical protein
MLKNPGDYDASLEVSSRPLMPLMEYTLDEDGRMTVQNETAVWYRYIAEDHIFLKSRIIIELN